MRDIINATISDDHFLKCSTYSIARNGEGLAPCLSISLPDGLLNYWAYIDFKKPNGETLKTPRIDVNEGKITYNIPCAVLDADGELEVQVVFQNEDGTIWKSYVKNFAVRYSINAVDDIPEKEDFITRAQKILDELKAVEETLGNTILKSYAGEIKSGETLTISPETASGWYLLRAGARIEYLSESSYYTVSGDGMAFNTSTDFDIQYDTELFISGTNVLSGTTLRPESALQYIYIGVGTDRETYSSTEELISYNRWVYKWQCVYTDGYYNSASGTFTEEKREYTAILEKLSNADIVYDPESENAQSGSAVAQAINDTIGDINAILATVVDGGAE